MPVRISRDKVTPLEKEKVQELKVLPIVDMGRRMQKTETASMRFSCIGVRRMLRVRGAVSATCNGFITSGRSNPRQLFFSADLSNAG